MGNCINLPLSPKVHILNEAEKEHTDTASKLVEEVSCGLYHGYEFVPPSLPHPPLPPGTKFEPRKDGRPLPHDHSISFKITRKESCRGRGIKIVITRQQLQFLLRDAKMLQFMKKGIRSSGTFMRGNRKWRPSLSAIPEVPDL